VYPIGAKPSHQLSWWHYIELFKIEDPLERRFTIVYREVSALFAPFMTNSAKGLPVKRKSL
jgi:hypothetical protein